MSSLSPGFLATTEAGQGECVRPREDLANARVVASVCGDVARKRYRVVKSLIPASDLGVDRQTGSGSIVLRMPRAVAICIDLTASARDLRCSPIQSPVASNINSSKNGSAQTPADPFSVTVLGGDGVGPEVVRQAVRVLAAAFDYLGRELRLEYHAFGGAALEEAGDPFPAETKSACLQSSAVLLGAVGGPAWDDVAPELRPERGLLRLRSTLGTFANLRPARYFEALEASSPLRPEIARTVDLVVVRELTGGIYFGPGSTETQSGVLTAQSSMRYSEDEVRRIANVAFETARARSGRVISVDKANVLDVSRLWRRVVTDVHREAYPDILLEHGYIDSTAMRLVTSPGQFDVLLTSNLFGDILSDIAATLPGSLGMLPSSSVGGNTMGIYEPVHGSAPDIAGRDLANPYGAILSVAMLLEDAGERETSLAVTQSVDDALSTGFLTPDIAGAGRGVSTTAAGDAVVRFLASRLPGPTINESREADRHASAT